MTRRYTEVRVTKHNLLLDTFKVSFRHLETRYYEIFRDEETANAAAEELKNGQWDPFNEEPFTNTGKER